MSELKEAFVHAARTWKTLFLTLLKWLLLSIVIGVAVGGIASVFAHIVTYATAFRQAHDWILFGLPIGGLVIVFIYKITGQEKNSGTNRVLAVVRSTETVMPGRVAPLILLSTAITHLFGGSSGREGAALQFGASLGDWFGRKIRLNESDRKIVTLAAMSAAFSALFGTPLAAAIFPMEVVSVGIMYYGALVPCVFSAFLAQYISVLLKVRKLTVPYQVFAPQFYGIEAIKAIGLAVCFAISGTIFCILLHTCEHKFKQWISNPYLRVAAGGIAVIVLRFVVQTDAYLGLGGEVIDASFHDPMGFEMFLLKMLFTCLTLCAGFKGGEIVPTLFIGATLGSALSSAAGLPPDICAACGMVGVFCAVTNSPVSSLLIAFELFGATGMPFYCVVIAVSYLLSGYQSLYHEQKIMYSKTENKYINKNTD